MNIARTITLDKKVSRLFLCAVKAALCLLLPVILAIRFSPMSPREEA